MKKWGAENEKKGEKSAVKTFEVKLNKWNDIHLKNEDSSLEAFPFTVDETLPMQAEKSKLSFKFSQQ